LESGVSNTHVHPLLSGILDQIAAFPQAANDATRRAVACRVTVSRSDAHETFTGLYPSTADAVIAGMDRAATPECAVSVRRLA
jgi:hypothetical protein